MKRIIMVCTILFIAALPAAAVENFFLLQNACVRCHLLLEDQAGGISVIEWKGSVHFRMDSTCTDCHGGSKFASLSFKRGHMGLPEKSETVAICGKCHKEAGEDFSGSRKALKEESASKPVCKVSCIDCHGYHRVLKADGSLVNDKTCGSCHSPDRAKPLIKTIADAENSFNSIETKIEGYDREAFPTQSFKYKLDDIHWNYARSFHSQPAGKIRESIIGNTMKSLSDLGGEIDGKSPLKWKLEGAAVVIFLIAFTAVVWIYRQTIH